MKKIAVFLLPLVICIYLFPGNFVSADGALTISLSAVAADPGNSVDVEVRIAGNPGINSLKIKIGYDSEKLTLLSAKNEGIFETMNYLGAQTIDKNPYIMVWVSASDISEDGKIGVLTFRVNEKAAPGDAVLSLTCSFCSNQNGRDVNAALQNGTIRIAGEVPPSPATPAGDQTPDPGLPSQTPAAGTAAPSSEAPNPTAQTGTSAPSEKTASPSAGGMEASSAPATPDPSGSDSPTQGAAEPADSSSSGKWRLLFLLLIPAAAVAAYFLYRKKKNRN